MSEIVEIGDEEFPRAAVKEREKDQSSLVASLCEQSAEPTRMVLPVQNVVYHVEAEWNQLPAQLKELETATKLVNAEEERRRTTNSVDGVRQKRKSRVEGPDQLLDYMISQMGNICTRLSQVVRAAADALTCARGACTGPCTTFHTSFEELVAQDERRMRDGTYQSTENARGAFHKHATQLEGVWVVPLSKLHEALSPFAKRSFDDLNSFLADLNTTLYSGDSPGAGSPSAPLSAPLLSSSLLSSPLGLTEEAFVKAAQSFPRPSSRKFRLLGCIVEACFGCQNTPRQDAKMNQSTPHANIKSVSPSPCESVGAVESGRRENAEEVRCSPLQPLAARCSSLQPVAAPCSLSRRPAFSLLPLSAHLFLFTT